MTDRDGWVLVLLDAPDWVDPIRVMKGLFLAQNEVGPDQMRPVSDPPFAFQPYSYGPFTSTVYSVLDSLATRGLVESRKLAGRSYSEWRLTDAGRSEARSAHTSLGMDVVERLTNARQLILRRSFDGLARYVYERYPDSAIRSVHPAAKA